MRISRFRKDIGRVSLQFFPDGYPYSTAIAVDGAELRVHGTEELRDLHYVLGRLLSHIEREEDRT